MFVQQGEILRAAAFQMDSTTKKQEEQVVDGGYFENSGATTAFDLARAIQRYNDNNLNAIFLQISSDPTHQELTDDYPGFIASGHIGGDFVAPIFALTNTRSSRAEYQSSVVKGEMPDFRTDEKRGYAELDMNTFCGWGAPLGWTLSERVRKALTPYDICEEPTTPRNRMDQRYFCSVHKIDYIDTIIKAVKSHEKPCLISDDQQALNTAD